MEASHEAQVPRALARHASVVVAAAIAVAVTGFLSGVRPREAVRAPKHERSAAVEGVAPPAPTYRTIDSRRIGPNAGFASQLEALQPPPALTETKHAPAAAWERDAAMADRAQRRAYDGAPPVIPHAVDARDVASCLACHGEGLRVESRVAPKVGHAHYLSCTQCHVEQGGGSFAPDRLRALPEGLSTFEGLARSGPGTRAGPGAPPVIPHATAMRSDCRSCHGPLAPEGLRTSHPERVSCTQCHGPSAELDQRRFEAADRVGPTLSTETPR